MLATALDRFIAKCMRRFTMPNVLADMCKALKREHQFTLQGSLATYIDRFTEIPTSIAQVILASRASRLPHELQASF